MTYVLDDSDTPAQEAARRGKLQREIWRLTILALSRVRLPPGDPDRRRISHLCRVDLAVISDEEVASLHRLAWICRRQIGRSLAPKTNPDDPIVREFARREMEPQHGR